MFFNTTGLFFFLIGPWGSDIETDAVGLGWARVDPGLLFGFDCSMGQQSGAQPKSRGNMDRIISLLITELKRGE